MEKRDVAIDICALVAMLAMSLCLSAGDVAGTDWSIQTVDGLGNVGEYTSIALDSAGNPHISYWDHDAWRLKYARWTGSDWAISIVDSSASTGLFNSIALDQQDRPQIGYFNQSGASVMYANWTGISWDIESVDSVWAAFISIDIDSHGIPHMSYYDMSAHVLKYANRTGSAWNVQVIDAISNNGTWSTLKIDQNDVPRIAYRGSTGVLRYAVKSGTTWSFQDVDKVGDNIGVSLALTNTQSPRISYRDHLNGSMKFARWNGSSWIIDVVDATIAHGDYTALAIDSLGNARIAYNDMDNGDLRYAYWNGTHWNILILDSLDDVGITPSMAIDGNEVAHISYRDETNQDLKYVRVSGVPSPPVGLAAIPGDASVTLNWSPGESGISPITNYRVYRGSTSGGEAFLVETGNLVTYLDAGLVNGQTYYYQVSAVNPAGEGPRSNEVNATPVAVPSQPLNVHAKAGNGNVTLTWNVPATDGGAQITNYKIFRGTTSGGETNLITVGNVLTYTDSSVVNEQTYYYKVSAINGVGESPASAETSAMPTANPGSTQDGKSIFGEVWFWVLIVVIVTILVAAVFFMRRARGRRSAT